jgi:riboflavin kinase/FMN adenylyltransferase
MKLCRRQVITHGVRKGAGVAVTIGAFDGIHIGHQALLARTRALAAAANLSTMLLSFEPLPMEFLHAAEPPARLTNFRERWRILEATGIDELCLLRFDARLRELSGEQFMAMLRDLNVRRVVVGHDFRFGKQHSATAEWCREQASDYGFSVEIVPPVTQDECRVGSRLVREALARADLDQAARLLGRPYAMWGRVQRGAQLGRTLGFATANVAPRRRRLPLSGIFAVRVNAPALWPRLGWPAVASLGTRPTVNGVAPLLEAHLFDFDGSLYGHEIEVQFVRKLRDEQKFDSVDLLVAQMHRDAAEARHLLET